MKQEKDNMKQQLELNSKKQTTSAFNGCGGQLEKESAVVYYNCSPD